VSVLALIGQETTEKSWPQKKSKPTEKQCYQIFEKLILCKNGKIITGFETAQLYT